MDVARRKAVDVASATGGDSGKATAVVTVTMADERRG